MIHVCFGLYDKDGRYSKFTATTIASIFANTSSKVTAHILHDNTLTLDNRDKFIYLAGKYGQQIKFYNVEKICAADIKIICQLMSEGAMFERFSIGAVYRLLIANVLPTDVEKLFYFDSDIIFNLDIKELAEINLAGKPFAAVSEFDIGLTNPHFYSAHNLVATNAIAYTEYFNSAVLIIDLNYWRTNFKLLNEGLNYVAQNTDCNYFDQDVLNYCFGKNYFHLSEKYNCWVIIERKKTSLTRKAIYHYVSQSLGLNMQDNFNSLWFKYFFETPFFDKESLGRIYEGVQQLQHKEKSNLIWLSKAMAGKQRAFFILPHNLEALKRIFNIEDNEEIISADSPNSFIRMVNSMGGGDKIFFVFALNFRKISIGLTNAGFVEGKDFVNGMIFLSEFQGVPLNSYQLVKAM